jgi:two-component system response regulator AtoC
MPIEISDHFQEYHWPGNVRELENVIRRAVALRDWSFVLNDLRPEKGNTKHAGEEEVEARNWRDDWRDEIIREAIKKPDFSLKRITKSHIAEAERLAIIETLQRTQWNRRVAARLLGVSYKTLLNRIEEFHIKSA